MATRKSQGERDALCVARAYDDMDIEDLKDLWVEVTQVLADRVPQELNLMVGIIGGMSSKTGRGMCPSCNKIIEDGQADDGPGRNIQAVSRKPTHPPPDYTPCEDCRFCNGETGECTGGFDDETCPEVKNADRGTCSDCGYMIFNTCANTEGKYFSEAVVQNDTCEWWVRGNNFRWTIHTTPRHDCFHIFDISKPDSKSLCGLALINPGHAYLTGPPSEVEEEVCSECSKVLEVLI